MATATAVVQSLGAMVFLSDYLGVDGLLDTLSYTNAAGLILRTDGMLCQEPVIEDVIEGHWTQPIPKPSPTKSNKQLFQEGKTLRNPREPSHTQFKHPHHLQHRITVTSSRQVIQPYPWAPFPKKSPWYFHRGNSTCIHLHGIYIKMVFLSLNQHIPMPSFHDFPISFAMFKKPMPLFPTLRIAISNKNDNYYKIL